MEVGGKIRKMAAHHQMVEHWQRSVGDPLRSIIVAAQQIVELSGDKPEVAVDVLRDLLERVDALPARTVLRFALKEALMRVDDRRGAIEQLHEVIMENSRKLRYVKPRRPAPPEHRGRSEGRRQPQRPKHKERGPERQGRGGPERR